MNTRLATTLVIGALILPVAGYAADTKSVTESVKENVGDAVITTKIKAEFAKDKLVRARNIKVDTDDKGVVTLSGNAKSRAEAEVDDWKKDGSIGTSHPPTKKKAIKQAVAIALAKAGKSRNTQPRRRNAS